MDADSGHAMQGSGDIAGIGRGVAIICERGQENYLKGTRSERLVLVFAVTIAHIELSATVGTWQFED